MKRTRTRLVIALIAALLTLALAAAVYAQVAAQKPYPEGEGAQAAGSRVAPEPPQRGAPEGEAGRTGTGAISEVPPDLSLLYVFSGATDDGEQGSSSRHEATSIHCTNIDDSANSRVWIEVYQWDGTDVFTGTVNMPPRTTFTFSTQNTTIYFDDVILGGSPGTAAIFQGHGRVYSEHPRVVCTAQVVDPLGYPPAFVSALELVRR